MRSPELPSERVERLLRELVSELQPNDQLPTMRTLAERWGTSQETVSRVVRKLKAEGLVFTRGRWGVFKSG